ncbi:MAG: GntR family transcriptional regulator [Polyangiaceae bacterium]|nr:GntR family transcriptional regulator [Polyangiaceae bacterium]
MLNPGSPVPLYRQLSDLLAADIRTGRYQSGERLPSEPALCRAFNVGRPTVRQATETLVQKKLIERRRGSGTFVLARPPEVDVFSAFGTVAAFKAQGLELKVKVVESLRRRRFAEAVESPLAGKQVFQFSRVGHLKQEPVLLERFFLSAEVFAGIEGVDLEQASLSEVVKERLFLTPLGGRQSFTVKALGEKWGHFLGISARTQLLLIQRSLDFRGSPGALFSELYCRSDRVTFSQTIQASQ